MKIGRFQWNDETIYGVVQGDQVLSVIGNIFEDFEVGNPLCGVDEIQFLPPTEPRSIVAMGINSERRVKQHYSSSRNIQYHGPVVFLKPCSSVIGHLDPIVKPKIAQNIGAAGELVVVIKKRAKLIDESEASKYILGYTCGNDLASGDLFVADSQQTLRAHGFDTATSFGPFIETEVSPNQLTINLKINGEIASTGSTSEMIYGVDMVVSYLSQFMTLIPGDLIFMGTPLGTGVQVGDLVEVEIEGIGILRNEVVAQE
jgi:2-keto-4-pentenoate hydratase/2-oxohepta-3-ene-1,7-dioic acid hydratase in catechol pathway